MITLRYKNGWIHEDLKTGLIEAQFNFTLKRCKTIRSAKLWISKNMKGG